MNSRIPLLGGFILVQLLLVGVLYMGERETADEVWLTFAADEVTAMHISDAETTVTLERGDNGWHVQDYPADEAKIGEIMAKLAGMQAAWPVATSSDSQQRFEVAEDNFQRQLVLQAGEATAVDLYLGTSPGYQRVHARQAGSDDIYSIALSNYELPLNTDGWLDKGQLALNEALTAITVRLNSDTEHRLESGEEGWLYNGEAANQTEASTYANRYKSLRVLNTASAADWQSAEPMAAIDLVWAGGEKTLNIAKLEEDYLIAEEQRYFKVATYIAEQLLLTDVDLTGTANQ